MRTLPALAAVVLAAGALSPSVAAQARTTPAPEVHRHPAPPYLPDTMRPVPIPHAGEPVVPRLELPRR